MGMDWLRGIVGSTDQMVPAGQQFVSPYGAQPPQGAPAGGWGGPPQGGAPAAGWGGPPMGGQASPPGGAPAAGWGGPPMGGQAAPPGGAPAAGWGGPPPAASWGGPPQGGQAAPPMAAPAAAPVAGDPAPPAWAPPPGATMTPEAQIAMLQARCDGLVRDVEAIALFARTLLTLLEERQIVNQQQFQETRKRLDLLDGKLDDRIASGA